MNLIGNAAAPYLLWIKLAAVIAALSGAAYAGNAARGHWDAGKIAKAQAATVRAIADRDAWRAASAQWKRAIELQNKANAKAQADAARDATQAAAATAKAATAEQAYQRRRREIDAAAARDASAPCASIVIEGSPLE